MDILTTTAFRRQFLADIAAARRRIALQFMTFEGDQAGWELARLLLEKARQGVAVRLLIDRFSDYYLSDRLVIFPTRWREFLSTQRMFRALRQGGVLLRRSGGGVRPTLHSLLQRNHKKLAIIDDIGYLGGINISDHNYGWHDFMVRFADGRTEDLLHDFDAGWAGKRLPPSGELLHSSQLGRRVPDLIRSAREEIIVSSPYVWDLPTVRLLGEAAQAGRRVVVLSIPRSNFIFVRLGFNYLLHQLQEKGAEVLFYEEFSHAKYLIVDRSEVVFGSANFGYPSYHILEELCLHSRDSELVDTFVRRLYLPEREKAQPAPRRRRAPLLGRPASHLFYLFLRLHSRRLPDYGPGAPPAASEHALQRRERSGAR